MYVNISHADITCPFCQHFNFSKKTVKQLKNVRQKEEKYLISGDFYAKLFTRDILLNSLFPPKRGSQRPKGGKKA